MSIEIWLAYFSATVIYSFIPGSGTVNSINNGMVYGLRKSVISILGLQIGLAFYIVLIGMGVGAIVSQSAVAFTTIKWLGVVYLIWLGIQKCKEQTFSETEIKPIETSEWKLFRNAIVVNLTNPKTVIFFAALLPQFLDPAGSHKVQITLMGVTTIMVDTTVMLLYAVLASRLSKFIRSPRIVRKLNRIFGSMFITCGALLATAKA
ncbi:homoserine/homoserine lactone efflux protein [Photobacterium sp. J15]|uniref:homoserine/homoserine lactone efflux protein n=1 Tax=Photobacterium sp. J15 TaxID=265901 RepID=UPI0007E2DF20|nr:homoserine/homoserine lactone efflux protein [Photobacterium sp. J15]